MACCGYGGNSSSMNNIFDPSRHKVVAVAEDGSHLHVTLGELKADMAELPPVVVTVPDPVPDKLAVAVALASHAIVCGVQAGDFRWHGGGSDFTIDGQRFDAPGLIEHAKSKL